MLLRIVLSVALVGVASFGLFVWRFLPFPPEPGFPPPADRAEARAQDIAQLRHLTELDWSFDAEEVTRFHAALDALSQSAAELSDPAFDLAVRRAVAIADNAHTNVSPLREARHYALLPLRFYRFAEGLIVVRATDEHADLLGARVLGVEGMQLEPVTAQLSTTIGGGEGRWRYYEPFLLLAPALLHADGLARQPDRLTLRFRRPDGTETERVLPAMPPPSPLSLPSAALLPRELRGEGGSWRHAIPPDGAPRRLLRREETAYHEPLEGAFYVRVHRMEEGPTDEALAQALAEIQTTRPDNVIVDLRDNTGGSTRGAAFARGVTQALGTDGRVFVLVNQGTFSAALMFAALLETHGGAQVRFVGAGFGDRPQFWADGGPLLRLPHAGIAIPAWRAYYDLERGCPDWWQCFWPYVPGEPQAGTLAIDTHLEPRFADYVSGRDTVLDHALLLARES